MSLCPDIGLSSRLGCLQIARGEETWSGDLEYDLPGGKAKARFTGTCAGAFNGFSRAQRDIAAAHTDP